MVIFFKKLDKIEIFEIFIKKIATFLIFFLKTKSDSNIHQIKCMKLHHFNHFLGGVACPRTPLAKRMA